MTDLIPKKRKSRAKPKAEHKPNGRPRTALTNDRKATIVSLIRGGNFMTTAAAFAGLSVDTVNDALKEGRASYTGPNREFVVAVDKAHAEWVASLVAATTAAAHTHPEIALKMLARRSKEWSDRDFTLKSSAEVVTDVRPLIAEDIQMDSATNAAYLEYLARLSESGAFDPGGPLHSPKSGNAQDNN